MIKRICKTMLIIIIILAAVIGLLLLCRYVYICKVKKEHKIVTKDGIDQVEIHEIGGIDQYFYIRGNHRENPVILMINGGMPMIPMLHLYQYDWEENFTVVNWDRRASGETYFLNQDHTEEILATMNDEIYINDIKEAVDYLYDYFGSKKIILLADSMGTTLASRYCMQYPEKVACYIGSAQVTNLREDMKLCTADLIQKAKLASKEKDVQKINELASKLDEPDAFLSAILPLFQYGSTYISKETVADSLGIYFNGMTSPYFPIVHLSYYFKSDELKEPLLPYIQDFNLETYGTDFKVPVAFIIGENDYITKYTIQAYFDKMKAPQKYLYYVPNAGHDALQQNPDDFFKILKQVVDQMN